MKAREFWIKTRGSQGDREVDISDSDHWVATIVQQVYPSPDNPKAVKMGPWIHVIEYSEYENLKKALERIAEGIPGGIEDNLYWCQATANEALEKKLTNLAAIGLAQHEVNQRLAEQNKIMREALEMALLKLERLGNAETTGLDLTHPSVSIPAIKRIVLGIASDLAKCGSSESTNKEE